MPATYPAPDDTVDQFTRPDGTTWGHNIDHGRLIDTMENVKAWGAYGDGTHDDHVAIQAAVDSGKDLFFPRGAYYIGANTITLTNYNQRLVGAGHLATAIVSHNTYTLQSRTSGPQDRVELHYMALGPDGTSTSGGGLKVDTAPGTTGYHSAWVITDCAFGGRGTDPAAIFDGWIGSWIDRCDFNAQDAPTCIIKAENFVSQYASITRSRFGPQSYSTNPRNAGLVNESWGTLRLTDVDFENANVGLYTAAGALVTNCHWEANKSHNVYVTDPMANLVMIECEFCYMDGTDPDASHIYLNGGPAQETGSASGFLLESCMFKDGSPGPAVYLNTTAWVHGLSFIRNKGFSRASITGNTPSRLFFLGENGYGSEAEFGGATLKGVAGIEAPIAFGTANNYISFIANGMPVFRTVDDPSGYGGETIGTYGFILYFDPADNKIKARVRDETGAMFTQVLTN